MRGTRGRPFLVTVLSVALAAGAVLPAAISGASGGGDAPTAQVAKKKCKKGYKLKKGKCRKKKGPNPYVEGQPCDPAKSKHYAEYGFLCLPQPQPDGTTPYLLVKSLA
jgi:hypothetical protein